MGVLDSTEFAPATEYERPKDQFSTARRMKKGHMSAVRYRPEDDHKYEKFGLLFINLFDLLFLVLNKISLYLIILDNYLIIYIAMISYQHFYDFHSINVKL